MVSCPNSPDGVVVVVGGGGVDVVGVVGIVGVVGAVGVVGVVGAVGVVGVGGVGGVGGVEMLLATFAKRFRWNHHRNDSSIFGEWAIHQIDVPRPPTNPVDRERLWRHCNIP
jgi:hypothetical protein